MPDCAIAVNNLTKVYRLYHRPLDRFKEALPGIRRKYHRDFFALREITFQVRCGETLGIIGRNGSGKSTLLKLVAGILTPNLGSVATRGRIAALLELGAGFNPELTGLENYYFNGAIMGYTRREMDVAREKMEAFADIGDYIEQPIKTYSSGMFVRLAFAVAITVDPDILIVDEALAVGDLNFQARCYRKLNELQAAGRTILFVSHALDSILRYCSRVLLLDRGRLIADADPKQAVDAYKQLLAGCYDQTGAETPRSDPGAEPLVYGNLAAEIFEFGLFDEHNRPVSLLQHGQRFCIRLRARFNADIRDPIFAFTIKDLKGVELTGTNTHFKNIATGLHRRNTCASIEFEQVWNGAAGRYALSLGCTGYEGDSVIVYHRLYDILFFETLSARPMVGCYDLDSAVRICRT